MAEKEVSTVDPVTTAGEVVTTASPTETARGNVFALRLQAQMQAELEEEDRLVRQREEEANIVSWDNVQAMIDIDYQMAQQMQVEEQ
ncbi:hypothetical protein Tco_1088476 [Tanacetum coccineum]